MSPKREAETTLKRLRGYWMKAAKEAKEEGAKNDIANVPAWFRGYACASRNIVNDLDKIAEAQEEKP